MNTNKNYIALTDNEIVESLKRGDRNVTRDYFYGYCRMAYCIYDKQYSLNNKPGLDFYSLAHEYYIYLLKHDWQPLMHRKDNVKLKTWMTNGFRYIVLDALKQYQKDAQLASFEDRIARQNVSFDIAESPDLRQNFTETIDDICKIYYPNDRKASEILRMILVFGFSGKEVARELGITPSAVSQRFSSMMKHTVIPYFQHFYTLDMPIYGSSDGITAYQRHRFDISECDAMASSMEELPRIISPQSASFDEEQPKIIFSRSAYYKEMPAPINRRTAPQWITSLQPNDVFVFGSNLAGIHGGGAAYQALKHFGAVMGQGEGLQGQSYAIPSMQGSAATIAPYVDRFVDFAESHPDLRFLVTQIGCGIAGFDVEDIAPLFETALSSPNIYLPKNFVRWLDENEM